MYKEQRDHFMGGGASQMDENVLAKRIDMNGAGNAKPGSFFVLLIPIVIFAVIFTVFFNDFRFSGNFFFFFLVAGLFILISILGIVASTKIRKVVKKAPIAVRVSSDFTLDLFLDNGQRKTVYEHCPCGRFLQQTPSHEHRLCVELQTQKRRDHQTQFH